MKNSLKLCSALVALCLASCGTDRILQLGSVRTSCTVAGASALPPIVCTDYRGSLFFATGNAAALDCEAQKAACPACDQKIFSQSASCSEINAARGPAIAACSLKTGEAGEKELRFFAPSTSAQAKAHCTAQGGSLLTAPFLGKVR